MIKKIILVSIITLTLIILGLFFILQKNEVQAPTVKVKKQAQKNTENQKQKEVEIGTIETQKIDTSSWKTYRNEEFGFEVRYPGKWDVLPGSGVDKNKFMKHDRIIIYLGDKNKYGKYGYDGEVFIFVYNIQDKTLTNIIKNTGSQFSDKEVKTENIIINGINATKVIITTETLKDWWYEAVIFEQEDKIYWINSGAKQNIIFQEIYNSFKILK